MKLARVILTLSIATAAPLLAAQQPPPIATPPAAAAATKLPTFDVISVKVNTSGSRNISMGSTPDGLRATNIPAQLIFKQAFAFALNDSLIFGAPAWAQTTRFDIEAKVSSSDVDAFKALTDAQRRLMVVQILTTRFQLAYHVEARMLPEYALVLAKGGSKLQPSQPGNDANGHPKRSTMNVHDGLLTAQGVPLDPLIHFLSDRVGRPVEDKTGLTGLYDFTLQLGDQGHDSPSSGPDPSSSDPTAPSIFTAVQEQLGLKLEAEKGPVQVLVIDHMEQPAAN
jgi:uncharacterized protein (TIGR03435 family)